ncbi:MAG TPA: N-acetylmuramoyl-L-alanine amidase [Acidobacteriaceae bacterium]|nr:N-acetylmuramoyl-L-alanine amidase [Acidobacteriaceae bacterium]
MAKPDVKPATPPAAAPSTSSASAPNAAAAPGSSNSETLPTPRILLPAPQPRTIIVIDPAHGGPDTGARINDHLAEKDVVLALAARLRVTLQSHNFTIVTTRDSDPAAGLTTNQRAEIANHTSAIACLVLHATATGNGVHLFTSALAPAQHHGILPWATAQAAFAGQSAALQRELNTAFIHAQIATVNAQAGVAPLDNLTCPAVAVEIAPYLAPDASNTIDVSDPDYQQHVAETITTALVFWRVHQSGPMNGVAQ